jgi:AraC-like DNA-binding protein
VLPRISGKPGLGATLFRLATSLYEQAEEMNKGDGLAAIGAYLDILARCITRPESASTKLGCCAQLRPRVEYFIETHLQEPTLCPAIIAAAAGISVRHLHRLFAAKSCTVAEWIRERRLERCRTDLSDPHLRERHITDIALGWGFSDSAHFSHSFKQEFGVSPREFRSHASSGKLAQIPPTPHRQPGAN